jgi:hypothetical protein
MRLAAAAGWYWWLGGRRSEGIELMIAATNVPGEVTDDVRAMTYALVVLYVTSGRGDQHLGAEWIHKAYRFGQLSQHGNPLLGLVTPLERLLQAPAEAVTAFESSLDSDDPWVRAVARWQVGKMRTVFGEGGRETEAHLELALAEFQALGERYGISLALSELAAQLARRGELAGACEYYEQAIAVLTELGAVEDVIEVRTQQALLYWLHGDQDVSAAAIAEAERSAEGVTWPYALVNLALAKAELARLGGDTEEARHQLGVATTLLGDAVEQPVVRAEIHNLLGYLADDLQEARTQRVAAWQAAFEAGAPIVIAQTLVGVADLAARLDQYEQAARLLAASDGVRGLPDRSHPDAARIERDARRGRVRRRAGLSWSRSRSPLEWAASRGHPVLVGRPADACGARRRALNDELSTPDAPRLVTLDGAVEAERAHPRWTHRAFGVLHFVRRVGEPQRWVVHPARKGSL